jgi:flagellar biosynthesis protein FlhB
MGLCYLINKDHFDASGDLTKQAIDMGIHLLPWCIIGFTSLIVTTLYEEYSAKKEMEIVKKIIKTDGKKKIDTYVEKKNIGINIARVSILVLSVVLIVVGIFNGGAEDVLQKAINICTECIGLG